jgi:aminoglycoside phosphotransferase (APT) family kinase protein
MLPREEALAIWKKTSGLEVDETALAWWSLFNAVKGQAIWTSAAKEYRDGGFKDPVLAISGWYTARRHDEILAAALLKWEGLS